VGSGNGGRDGSFRGSGGGGAVGTSPSEVAAAAAVGAVTTTGVHGAVARPRHVGTPEDAASEAHGSNGGSPEDRVESRSHHKLHASTCWLFSVATTPPAGAARPS